jgi:transposase
MPWKESRIVDQRLQFLSSYQKEEMSVTDLCHEYGISRPTAYKWIKRYNEVGPEGLLDISRKPHGCAHATSLEVENEILALRKRFPSWGARKLKARLEKMNPNVVWPAASTVGQILRRAGLTNPVRKRRRTTRTQSPSPRSPLRTSYGAWTSRDGSALATGTDAMPSRSPMPTVAI